MAPSKRPETAPNQPNLKAHSRARVASPVLVSVLSVSIAILFGFFPAVTTALVAFSSSLRTRGQVENIGGWFSATEQRYDRWASAYLATQRATTVHSEDVAATEWPMFGSVFFLLSAEELVRVNSIQLTAELRASLRLAAEVIADEASGTWVKKKWGPHYLDKENVFYRMLVMLGLRAYAGITGDMQYAAIVERHAIGLMQELEAAPYHVLDDYPGECYPTDVVWATAAIGRIETIPKPDRERLARDVTASLMGTLSDRHGLPATLVDSRNGTLRQPARGCAVSGILSFAHELSPEAAEVWYQRYADQYWVENRWRAGFREHAVDSAAQFADVDSGPILFDVGTAASLFGIGAARVAGRFDHAAPLTMEAVAAAWPTPFGMLVPGIMGWAATDSWCLGETAFLFAMTRPNHGVRTTPFAGNPPLSVIGIILLYVALGAALFTREWRFWRSRLRK